jgi:hypothetical protein
MDEQLEHVIFCDAQNTNHSAVDRTLTPEIQRQLRLAGEATIMEHRAAQRRTEAFQRLRTDALYGDRQAADFLTVLGWDGS